MFPIVIGMTPSADERGAYLEPLLGSESTHGVILSKGWHSATFLPQVWRQLPEPKTFLAHLCRKAGMDASCWKAADIIVKVYQAEYFSE